MSQYQMLGSYIVKQSDKIKALEYTLQLKQLKKLEPETKQKIENVMEQIERDLHDEKNGNETPYGDIWERLRDTLEVDIQKWNYQVDVPQNVTKIK